MMLTERLTVGRSVANGIYSRVRAHWCLHAGDGGAEGKRACSSNRDFQLLYHKDRGSSQDSQDCTSCQSG